jgi:hypothetical protein
MSNGETEGGKAGAGENRAEQEFARYKQRLQQGLGGAMPPGFPFGPYGAYGPMPGWSLPPSLVGGGPPGSYFTAPVPQGGGYGGYGGDYYTSIVQSVGNTIRLGVDALNAALASGTRLLGGVGEAVGGVAWSDDYGYESHGGCGCGCGSCGCSSCCGCSCCEPSVGTCC